MKIKKSSWHYKFLVWMDMEPYGKTTVAGYIGLFILTFFYGVTFGWIIEGGRHLISHFHSEPIKFIDDKDNKENIE